jgi:hypothetical protein
MRRRALVAALSTLVGPVVSAPHATALPDGLALTPPMGFNNWNTTHCRAEFNEAMVKGIADKFVSAGLKDAGYRYVNIDDCWALPQRNSEGNLVPDPKRFPNGVKAVADYVHGKGLKFGIYTSAGTMFRLSRVGDGRTLTLQGVTFTKGLGAHAASEIEYHLGRKCSTVTASVGIDDEVGNRGSVVFQVFADGVEVADSGVPNGASATKSLSAGVAGADTLKLVVTNGGDNIDYDHADWANAGVTCA